jgi:hypothetical protein
VRPRLAGCGTTAATAVMQPATPVGFVACTVELSFVGSSSSAVAVAAVEYTAAMLAWAALPGPTNTNHIRHYN